MKILSSRCALFLLSWILTAPTWILLIVCC